VGHSYTCFPGELTKIILRITVGIWQRLVLRFSGMKWFNASVVLPEIGEEVLIRFNGMILLGSYDPKSGLFVDKLGAGCMAPLEQIKWARFEAPATPGGQK
jgi:hypothetical protein